jgi:hypothetical protein
MALKIIGAGYPRTGTMSLKIALEQLGLGPCHHMKEVIDHPQTAPLWMDAADGRPDWNRIFEGYASCIDAPSCYFWREIWKVYPDAKIIMTERDPEKWFESVNSTVFSRRWKETTSKMPLAAFFKKLTFDHYGDRLDDRDFMIGEFTRYKDEVKRLVPKERLLIYRGGDGWEPLCAFLGVPVPDAPYPRTNSREEISAMMAKAASQFAGGTTDPTLKWDENEKKGPDNTRKA